MPKIELLHIDCMEYMATLPDKAFELDKDYHESSVKRFKEQTAQMQIFQP